MGRLATFITIALWIPLSAGVSSAEPEIPPLAPNPQLDPRWVEEVMNGYEPYHQLTVEDFPVKELRYPGIAYWVEPFIHPYYTFMPREQHGMFFLYIKEWTVFSGFNKNLSGRKAGFRTMKEELPYAQAVLDLNEVYARRLGALQPAEIPRGSGRSWPEAQRNLEEAVQKLLQNRYAEERRELEKMASATNNGQNKKQVREFSATIKKKLAEVPPPSTPTPTPQSGGFQPIIPPPAQLSSTPK